MLALKDKCLHPTSKTPYVKSGIGGKQNSPEGKTVSFPILSLYETGLTSSFQGGMTHIFVVEFANEEDRTYYLEKDPVHLGFVKSIGGVVKNAQVVDFTPGVF
jgi:hypothetical protein